MKTRTFTEQMDSSISEPINWSTNLDKNIPVNMFASHNQN